MSIFTFLICAGILVLEGMHNNLIFPLSPLKALTSTHSRLRVNTLPQLASSTQSGT